MSNVLQGLAVEVGVALAQQHRMLATAESCTGGWIAQVITDIAGSSAWFERGFVTYSNAAKHDMLGVPEATIAMHGAVSEAVARAMAQGALAHSLAQVSVAVTGIAGPGGGSPSKPVGTVCFAWAGRVVTIASGVDPGHSGSVTTTPKDAPAMLLSEVCHFEGDRAEVRHQAVAHALHGLLGILRAFAKK